MKSATSVVQFLWVRPASSGVLPGHYEPGRMYKCLMTRALQESVKIPRFSVDLSRIQAYYWIVIMGKVKVASEGARTKEAQAEMLKTEMLRVLASWRLCCQIYDPCTAHWPFLHIFSLFAANQCKFLSINHLHAKLGFPGQAQSSLTSLIKLFFTFTMYEPAPQSIHLASSGSRSATNGRGKVGCDMPFMNRPFLLNAVPRLAAGGFSSYHRTGMAL